MQTKPLSWSEIRKRTAAFVAEWCGETYEKGEAQAFWSELLDAYGIRRRSVARFEQRAKKADGGRGYIDLFWPGMLIAEHKSLGHDLEAAEEQALGYLEGVTEAEQPRYVITSDFGRFRLRDLEAPPGESGVVEFPLEDLPKEAERFGFIAGYQKRAFGSEEQASASIKAAQLMADLYVELEKTGYPEHEASIFLVRTLFCLFADDAGLWERDLFSEFIETRTQADGSDLGAQMATLFQTLNRPVEKRLKALDEVLARFPYVNGLVFTETISIPYFDKAMRDKLIEAGHFNWGEISPAIFGSLFQAVKSKKARRKLGEHYTTETNILKVIEPLFLDELKERFIKEQHNAAGLRKLQRDMGNMRFLDPACGCGNFLIVAYREMRALELKILSRLQELDRRHLQTTVVLEDSDLVKVRMSNFFGIEVEEWPATIARTAMFLVQHQANQDMSLTIGVSPEMLPLSDSATIIHANALQTNWSDVVPASENLVVMGNPPFLGHASRTAEQAEDLRTVWGKSNIGRLDYVTGWYAKAVDFLGQENARWAFVSTSSITQGEPVPALFAPIFAAGWRIRFAHRTFAWTSEAPQAASVHCVIIGFDRRKTPNPTLFSYETLTSNPDRQPAKNINPYLVDGPNVLVTQRRSPLASQLSEFTFGSMPRGKALVVEPEEYEEVASDPVASKYLRRFIMGQELLNNKQRWCLWMTDLDPADVDRSPVLRERIKAV